MCAFISFQGLLVCTMDGSAKQLELKKQNKTKNAYNPYLNKMTNVENIQATCLNVYEEKTLIPIIKNENIFHTPQDINATFQTFYKNL